MKVADQLMKQLFLTMYITWRKMKEIIKIKKFKDIINKLK